MRRWSVVLLSTLLLSGCDDTTEGERLGTFTVRATRTQNGCGAQMGAKLPSAQFDVTLSLQRGALRWTPVGATSATGTFDVFQRTFRLSLETDIVARAADRRLDYPGCVLRRNDVIEGVVSSTPNAIDAGSSQGADAGSTVTSFRATETIAYGVASGDCAPVVGAAEGQVLALPCVVSYQMDATRSGP